MIRKKKVLLLTIKMQDMLDKPITALGLSEECANSLKENDNIKSVRDLIKKPKEFFTPNVEKCLNDYGFNITGRDIEYRYQKIMTIKQQELLGYNIMDLGIDVRPAEKISDKLGIETIEDLIRIEPEQLFSIRGIGPDVANGVISKVKEFGFEMGEKWTWIREQDTPEYVISEFKRLKLVAS